MKITKQQLHQMIQEALDETMKEIVGMPGGGAGVGKPDPRSEVDATAAVTSGYKPDMDKEWLAGLQQASKADPMLKSAVSAYQAALSSAPSRAAHDQSLANLQQMMQKGGVTPVDVVGKGPKGVEWLMKSVGTLTNKLKS